MTSTEHYMAAMGREILGGAGCVLIYMSADGWRWRFKGKGGLIQGDGGQGYSDKRDCIRGLEKVTGGSYERLYSQPTLSGLHYQQGMLTRWEGARTPTAAPVLVSYHVDVWPVPR